MAPPSSAGASPASPDLPETLSGLSRRTFLPPQEHAQPPVGRGGQLQVGPDVRRRPPHVDQAAAAIIGDPSLKRANKTHYETEFLALKLAVRVVASADEAIDHITTYGTRHSEAIVTEEIGSFNKWLSSLDSVPTVVALREQAERVQQEEVTKALNKLGSVDPKTEKIIRSLAAGIVNKMLHPPTVALRTEAAEKENLIDLVRRIYRLDSGEE